MKMPNVRCSNYVYIRTTRCNVAGHHLSIPSSLRTFTKKQIKQVLRHLTAVQEFLELRKPYYALLIRKVPKWSRVIIVLPPNLWGQISLFPRGQLPGTPGDAKPQTSKTLDNVSIRFLAGACAGATACSLTYPSLGIYGREYGDDDMTWYDMAFFDNVHSYMSLYM